MSDLRSIVDRELERVELRPFTLDAFHRRRQRKRRNQRIRAGVVGIAVALIVVLIGTSVIRSSPIPANLHPSPPIRHEAQLTVSTNGGIDVVDLATGELRVLLPDVRVSGFAWSPDGTELAYESQVHPCSLVVRNMETRIERVLTTGCGTHRSGASVDWSADGNWIAFTGPLSGGLGDPILPVMLMHPDGTREMQLKDPGGFPINAYAFSLSPDGSRIVFGSGAQIYTMNVDGTGRRLLAKGFSPDWSADGSTIAFERHARTPSASGDPFVWEAWIIHPDGSGLSKLYRREHCCLGLWATGPVWSPDGSRVAAVVRGRLRIIAAGGGATRVIPGLTILPPGSLAWRPPR